MILCVCVITYISGDLSFGMICLLVRKFLAIYDQSCASSLQANVIRKTTVLDVMRRLLQVRAFC